MRELLRSATLAPSSHNTQCWKFAFEEKAITILPDFSRRCPAVDAGDHQVFVSLGCSAENLVHCAGTLAEGRASFRRRTLDKLFSVASGNPAVPDRLGVGRLPYGRTFQILKAGCSRLALHARQIDQQSS